MNVGLQLARARQAQGLSREELATRANLSLASLAAIEEVDLDRLPDRFYLRGFVSAIARELGFDPDLASERYMLQLQNHSALDEFAAEGSAGLDAIQSEMSPKPTADFANVFPAEMQATLAEVSDVVDRRHKVVTRRWVLPAWPTWMRPASLTYAALAVVTLATVTSGAWFMVRKVWTPTDTTPLQEATIVEVNETLSTPESPRAPLSDTPEQSELSGLWMLTNHVEQSSKSAFNELRLGFRVQLDQTGNRIRGQGHKWTENGRRIAPRGRTPITVEGTIDNGRLELSFTEHGTRRTSRGTFDLQIMDDDALHGRFSTDAAQSSGRVQAVRISS